MRMTIAARLYPAPKHVVHGAVGTGWLGLVSSWVLLGFGGVLLGLGVGGMLATDESCGASSVLVCSVSSMGGAIAGATSLAVAVLFAIAIARGFGPSARWWVLPVLFASFGLAGAAGAFAGSDSVEGLLLTGAAVAAVGAAVLAVMLLRRGTAATHGWVRIDGLHASEVPFRAVDHVLPLAALASAAAGAAFAAHVARLLLTG